MYQRMAMMMCPQWPRPSSRPTACFRTRSEIMKKIDAAMAKMKTITAVVTVSRRLGQVTFDVSLRTCCRNWNGFVFAIACPPSIAGNPAPYPKSQDLETKETEGAAEPIPRLRKFREKSVVASFAMNWQGQQGSNLRPAV